MLFAELLGNFTRHPAIATAPVVLSSVGIAQFSRPERRESILFSFNR